MGCIWPLRGVISFWQDKSVKSEVLRSTHPDDPTPWFAVVNEYFKAGDKKGAANLLEDASLHFRENFPSQVDANTNTSWCCSAPP